MSLLDEFARVNPKLPCPICSKPDWCLVSRDDAANPSRVICSRTESHRRFGQAGWLHVLRKGASRWDGVRHRTIRVGTPAQAESFSQLAQRFREHLDDECLEMLARDLGVSADSLRRLGIGWTAGAWTFPMSDANRQVIGIALRRLDGSKFAITGSHVGLFVPSGLVEDERLFVCEGQTDTATILDLGFQAFGRAGARVGSRMVCDLAGQLCPSDVVVMGDGDQAGREGAEPLGSALAFARLATRVIYPPDGIKDAREWRKQGAQREDILAAVEGTAVRQVGVRVKTRGPR